VLTGMRLMGLHYKDELLAWSSSAAGDAVTLLGHHETGYEDCACVHCIMLRAQMERTYKLFGPSFLL
jgi:hypothetical protein